MPDLSTIARWLMILGLFILGMGALLWIAGRLNLPIGKLPGDIRFQAKGVTCIFPLATSILLSILLTLILNLVFRLLNR
jgi:hypothetical protein